jgi:hypothetical protein
MRLVRIVLWLLLAALASPFILTGYWPGTWFAVLWVLGLICGGRWAFFSSIDPDAPIFPARRTHKDRS